VQNTRLSYWAVVLALSLGVTGAVRGAGGPGDRPESDADADRLERQVRFLSAALAAARSESEALRARLDGAVLGAAPGEDGAPRLMEGGARVLDANRELGMLVMDAGARQGVRAGMVLMVMRADKPLARVRVTEVRRRVAGAVLEEWLSGSPYPGQGDRLVVAADGE
jgi:hypothetical protein